jgi:hypothetical protein
MSLKKRRCKWRGADIGLYQIAQAVETVAEISDPEGLMPPEWILAMIFDHIRDGDNISYRHNL